MELQGLQGIRLYHIPADQALDVLGPLGNHISIFLEIPSTQLFVIKEHQTLTVPESTHGMAQLCWLHYGSNQHRVGIWVPTLE